MDGTTPYEPVKPTAPIQKLLDFLTAEDTCIPVTVKNQLDLSTIEGLLQQAVDILNNIDADLDTIIDKLMDIIANLETINENIVDVVTALGDIINELGDVLAEL